MKRLACFLLSLVMAATMLTGCGSQSEKEGNTVEKVEAQPSQTMVNNNPVFNTFNFNGSVGHVISHVDQITNNYYD